ncbi:MAG TPA: NADP-dependent oxidoreductase [Candidatus Polarisedimenticolaceae bacterium]|nr:NADP-dependent oxidoreductase [Candidatus Polarisedimenticolaceae bacterium]
MKAVAIRAFGGPEKLAVMEMPDPKAARGEILIRTVAAGVNPVDWKMREGGLASLPHAFPLIPGWDVAGVVEDLGEGCHRFRRGERVFAYARKPFVQWGTYAELVVVPEADAAAMPPNLLFEEAAAVPCAALTAMQALAKAGVRKDTKLLILNGSGGVGHFALQLARVAGARTLATTGPKNQEFVMSQGAEAGIDHDRDDLVASVNARFDGGADAVIDAIGGAALERALHAVKPGGIVVSVAGATAAANGIRFERLNSRPSGDELEILAAHAQRKTLRPHVQTIFRLDEAAKAQHESRQGHVRGKLVLAL